MSMLDDMAAAIDKLRPNDAMDSMANQGVDLQHAQQGQEADAIHAQNQAAKAARMKNAPSKGPGLNLGNYADGGEVPQQGGASESFDNAPDAPTNIPINTPDVQQQPAILPPNLTSGPMESAMGQQLAGTEQAGQAQAQQSKEQLQAAKDVAAPAYDLQQSTQEHLKDAIQEVRDVSEDVKAGHIDPNRYMKNLSTSGQVATAIGLILGGIGGGGKTNLAMDVLQKNIDRDVDSQKDLVQAYQKNLGNYKDAVSMAQLATANVYANKIEQAAAKSGNPLAIARAKQASGEIIAKYAPMLSEIAYRQALLQGAQSGGIQPEQMVQGFVPQAEQPKALEAIGQVRQIRDSQKNLMSLFDKMGEQNTVMRTAGGLREPASAQAMEAQLLPILKDEVGRPDEFKLKKFMANTPQPGDMDSKIQQKRQQFQRLIEAEMQQKKSLLKGYNIDLDKFKPTSPVSIAKPNKNASYGK